MFFFSIQKEKSLKMFYYKVHNEQDQRSIQHNNRKVREKYREYERDLHEELN